MQTDARSIPAFLITLQIATDIREIINTDLQIKKLLHYLNEVCRVWVEICQLIRRPKSRHCFTHFLQCL